MPRGLCATLVLAGLFASAGCAASRPEMHLALATERGRIHVGMTAVELVKTLGRPTAAVIHEATLRAAGLDRATPVRLMTQVMIPDEVDRVVDAHLAAHRGAKHTPACDGDGIANLTLRSVGRSDSWTWRYHDRLVRAWVCEGLVASLQTLPAR